MPLWLFTFTFTLQIINLSSRPSKYHIPPIKHSIENLAAKIGICSYFRNATLDHKDVKMPEPQHVSQEGLAYAGTPSCCCSFCVYHICHSHTFYLNFRPRNVMPTCCIDEPSPKITKTVPMASGSTLLSIQLCVVHCGIVTCELIGALCTSYQSDSLLSLQ